MEQEYIYRPGRNSKLRLWLMSVAVILIVSLSLAYFLPNMLSKAFILFQQSISIQRLLGGLGILVLCILLELIAIGWSKSSLKKIIIRPSKTVRVDIFSYIISSLRIIEILAIVFSLGLSFLIPLWFRGLIGYNWLHAIKSPILQNICFVLILDFTLYWVHRLNHTVAAFWELHKFHHSASELTILTTSRLHPVEIAMNNIAFSFPLFLVGVPVDTFVIFFLFTNWLGHIHHSMIPWKWGLIGKYLFISPAAHRIHHSTEPHHFNKNFGTVTPIWDHLFGTWYDEQDLNEDVGIDDMQYNKKGIWPDYIYSYRNFLRKSTSFTKRNK